MTNSINGACARVFDEPRSHFQHKFCAICKERGVRVDAARVRMVKAEYQHEVGRMTRHAFGCANDKEPNDVFYYAATAALAGRGDVSARLVNNVAHSRGPAFIIFKDAAQVPDPLPAALAPLPEGLTERQQRVGSGMEEETINLIVKMGTLVPEKMCGRRGAMPEGLRAALYVDFPSATSTTTKKKGAAARARVARKNAVRTRPAAAAAAEEGGGQKRGGALHGVALRLRGSDEAQQQQEEEQQPDDDDGSASTSSPVLSSLPPPWAAAEAADAAAAAAALTVVSQSPTPAAAISPDLCLVARTAMHEEAICTTTTHTTTPSPHRAVAVASMSTSSTAGAWKRRRASMEEEDDDDVHALFHFARQGVNRERQ